MCQLKYRLFAISVWSYQTAPTYFTISVWWTYHTAPTYLLWHFNGKSDRPLNASHGKLIHAINLDKMHKPYN